MQIGTKVIWGVVLVVCLSAAVLIGDYIENKNAKIIPLGKAQISESASEDIAAATTAKAFKVYVVGEVAKPGLYSVGEGARVSDAVELAGGMTEKAVLENNNMAKLLRDGEKIIVLGEISDVALYPELKDKINLNTADLKELESLNGIGEVLAKRIFEEREKNGLFNDVKDILRVKGIGEAKLKLFENQVCVF